MKKILYSIFSTIAFSTLFLSNSNGPGAIQDSGLTGAPGDDMNGANPKTCQFCHSAGAFGPPSMTVRFFDSAGTTAVTGYLPSRLYTIRVTVTAGSGTPAGYGFQMIDIRKSNNANLKGFLPTQNTGIQITTLMKNARQYAEHTDRSTSNIFNVKWRAPQSGTGIVTFYASGTAVNGSGQSGDGSANTNSELPEGRVSTHEWAQNVDISLAPNPITEGVNIRLKSTAARRLQLKVNDILGQTFMVENWSVTVGENLRALDLSHLAKGAYMIQVIENQSVVSKKILKL